MAETKSRNVDGLRADWPSEGRGRKSSGKRVRTKGKGDEAYTESRVGSLGEEPLAEAADWAHTEGERLTVGRIEDAGRRVVVGVLERVGQSLAQAGVRADWLTVCGIGAGVWAGVFAAGRWWALALAALAVAGVADLLETTLARIDGVSARGLWLGALGDRIVDMAVTIGMLWWMVRIEQTPGALAWAIAGAAAVCGSYARARAEAAGCTQAGWPPGRSVRLPVWLAAIAATGLWPQGAGMIAGAVGGVAVYSMGARIHYAWSRLPSDMGGSQTL